MMEEEPVHALRRLMASHSPPLHALVVPSEDYHMSEYVSERDKRREFVSGFAGSAGLALITMDDARLWTDGRYFLQAAQELNENWKLMRMREDPAFEIWTADNLPVDASIGLDPWCLSIEKAQKWEQAFSKKGQKLVWLSKNLVDEVWKNRPQQKIQPANIQPLKFSGCSVAQKLKDLREKLSNANACGIVVTTLDEVAWLYNVRGNDVVHCPVVHAFAVVTLDSAFFYVDRRKVSQEVRNHLTESGVEVKDYDAIGSDVKLLASGELRSLPEKNDKKNSLVWLDPASCCFAIYLKVPSNQLLLELSPLALAKALKNPVELEGLRKAHIRDGAAVVHYLVWLDGQMQDVCGAAGYFLDRNETKKRKHLGDVKITEVSVSDKLEGFRAKQQHFKGLSFGTISSVGPNAALNHYSPQPQSCSKLDPDSIYLFDSGAQYQDGTTDITRTVHFGKPSFHEKACYTAVLKGHIALDTAIFPSGTPGHTLDILARLPLWKDGLDYRHGTGHGVGSYLNVHEGPHFIGSMPSYAQAVPLQPSMTVTNEPGYYEDGSFGIRLENVLVVNEAKTKFNFGNKGYLCFENISWAPYQKKLMNLSLLSPVEIEWLNNYHSKCRNALTPYMDDNEKAWLVRATEPIVISS